jgi:DinB superfamily
MPDQEPLSADVQSLRYGEPEMNNWEWFGKQIDTSTESLVWGMGLIPEERRVVKPPTKLGDWTANRQAFHILHYEREVALPAVRLWLGGRYPTFEGYDEGTAWDEGHSWESFLNELRRVRAEIISSLEQVPSEQWDDVKATPWGDKSLYWVVSKTYQHGIEHLSNMLRTAMLWDHYAEREARATARFHE